MLPSYSKPLSILSQLAEKWHSVKLGRISAYPHLPEELAWQQLQTLAPGLLEAKVTVRVKSSLQIRLLTLHSALQYEYYFQRSGAGHNWQLVQVWNPLAQ